MLRLCTHPLNTSEGGFAYGGNSYNARIQSQQIAPIQGMSENGIDLVPSVTLTIADPDKAIYLNYEKASGKGFRGASLSMTFIFWDADSSTFSSDSLVPFIGTCNKPETDENTLTVTATSKFNLSKRFLPTVPIQRRCPWIFPKTSTQRTAGANDADSIFYRCGYSPDVATTGVGNYSSGVTPFTDCAYTRSECEARGMFKVDSSARTTGRFGGSEYDVSTGGRSKEYASGKWIDITGNANEARYGDYFPMVYGTAVVDAVCMPVVGDGNSTRGEAVLCIGAVNNILRVVINDRVLPPANNLSGSNYIVQDALFRYNVISPGNRNGAPNLDTPWNGNGDPYGSLTTILWVVPRSVQEATGVPRIQALVQGPKIRVYTGTSTYSDTYTANPIWIMMDILTWSGFDYADFDIQTWIDAATFCDATINYTDQYGGTSSHARYSCSLVIRQRRSVADILKALRQGCNAFLSFNPSTGKLQVFCKQPLGGQQGSTPSGTNYSSPISSVNAAGASTNGYVAYDFTSANIARAADGKESSFKIVGRGNNDLPNIVNIRFINSENDYSEDSLRLYNDDDLARLNGQDTNESLSAIVNTLDQAKRIGSIYMAEGLLGNTQGDSRGTELYEFEASFRAVTLRVGHICRLTEPQHQITNQLIRILRIQPYTNWERTRILASFHSDSWYVNTFGQKADPEVASRRRDRLERASYPWCPGALAPDTDDPMFSEREYQPQVNIQYTPSGDGTGIALLRVSGQIPINEFSTINAPLVQQQGTTATSGGNLSGSGRVYFLALCAYDSAGLFSAPSAICQVAVTSVGTTNTAVIPVLQWPDGTSGYALFAGLSPERMSHQTSSSGTPSTVTLSTFFESGQYGIPDPEFDKLRIKVKRIRHSGVWGAVVSAIGTNTITIAGAAFTTNEYANYDLSLLGQENRFGFIPFLNWSVVSNTADVLTVNWDPSGSAMDVGDVVVMRSRPTVGSDGTGHYVEDALWVNGLSGGAGLEVDAEIGSYLRIISGTGRGYFYRIKDNTATRIYIEGSWIVTPDTTSRYVIEEAEWQVIKDTDSLFCNAPGDGPGASLTVQLEVTNYLAQTIAIQVVTLDGGGNESISTLSPYRDCYVIGDPFQAVVEATTHTQDETERTLYIDTATAGGPVTVTVPPPALNKGARLLYKRTGGTDDITLTGETIDGSSSLVIDSTYESVMLESDGAEYHSFIAGVGGGGSANDYYAVTLTASSTAISRTVGAAGTQLVIDITQDGTGGRAITWSSDFEDMLDVYVNISPGARTTYRFYSTGTKWRGSLWMEKP